GWEHADVGRRRKLDDAGQNGLRSAVKLFRDVGLYAQLRNPDPSNDCIDGPVEVGKNRFLALICVCFGKLLNTKLRCVDYANQPADGVLTGGPLLSQLVPLACDVGAGIEGCTVDGL